MNTPLWKQVRSRLACRQLPGRPDALARQTHAWLEARMLVSAFYAGLLYFALTDAPSWAELSEMGQAGLLWPVAWAHVTGLPVAAAVVTVLYLTGALAAAIAPGHRLGRALAAFGMLEFTALHYSAGKIGHGTHLWLLAAIVLIFLPDVGRSPGRRERQSYLNVFWTAHALILLTYSMSGLGKLLGALRQASQGQITAFHPQAMALHIADRLTETGSRSPVGLWLVDHVAVSWPLMLGTIYLQIFTFWSIFRPSLLRLWTGGLIAFHVATYWVLGIRFAPPILLLAMWGLASPFLPSQTPLKVMLTDLPIAGFVIKKWLKSPSVSHSMP